MEAMDYTQLQERYGGRFIAHQDGEILAVALSYEELCRKLEELEPDWDRLVIEYIEPADAAHVY